MSKFRITPVSLALFGAQMTPGAQSRNGEGDIENAVYLEKHRAKFHFSPPSGWMNDPNGMFFYEGEYHLFYQAYPDDIVWGPMHWAHAVSRDLLHWEHLPIALYPDPLGQIFSGCAVVDWKNTSGFGNDGQPPIIILFTHHNADRAQSGEDDFQYQSLAYSNDQGRTWTKYEGNPVLPNPGIRDFRDPKVFWHNDTNRWIMVLAAFDHLKIYSSPNLRTWTHESDFRTGKGGHDGVWECPDLFPLMEDGIQGEVKWILIQSLNPGGPHGGSGTQYFIGDFDGRRFTLDPIFAKVLGESEPAKTAARLLHKYRGNRYGEHWDIDGDEFVNMAVQGDPVTHGADQSLNAQSPTDSDTGNQWNERLKSKPFVIENKYMNFMIGGGAHSGDTRMDLVIDGNTVRTITGHKGKGLKWKSWNVSSWLGKTARVAITDSRSGVWGFVLLDFILFADEPAEATVDKAVWLDMGKDNYAAVSWSDIPEDEGRRLLMGWMSNWQYGQSVPTGAWRGAMTLVREMKLIRHLGEFRLVLQPAREMKTLRDAFKAIEPRDANTRKTIDLPGGTHELELEFSVGRGAGIIVELFNSRGNRILIGYDEPTTSYFIDRSEAGDNSFSDLFDGRHVAPCYYNPETVRMHIFVDSTSIELFADNGKTVMTDIFFPDEPLDRMQMLFNGNAELLSGSAYTLRSIW